MAPLFYQRYHHIALKNRNIALRKISIDKLKEYVLQYSDAYQYERAEWPEVSMAHKKH
nr:hypothetical protein [Orientia tsutsugamushi]